MKTPEIYKKIYVNSEADLPEKGEYEYVKIKGGNITSSRIKNHRDVIWWITFVDWYLQPIEEQEQNSQEELIHDINFIKWYSGMGESRIRKAHERYINEYLKSK